MFAAAALLAVACASEDDRPASFEYIYAVAIEPSCATIGCHSSFAATAGLRLDTLEGAYTALTGTVCEPDGEPPPGEPPRSWVAPGQPDRSELMFLLRGEGRALRMPPDRPMPEADIELIERWILEGALCN